MAQYVYLLQSKVHINSNEHVYKIGKTRNFPGRFQQYPKGSVVLGVWNCRDCNTTEKEMLTAFRQRYEERRDAGSEYFQGDWREMRDHIHEIVGRLEKEEDLRDGRVKVCSVEEKTFVISMFE